MKFAIASLCLVFSVSSALAEQLELPLQPRQCIDAKQAQKVLLNYLNPLVGQILTEDFPFLDGDRDAKSLTSVEVKDAVAKLKWNQSSFQYFSGTVAEGYCATAASCWGWYAVDCQGQINPLIDGEE